MPTLYLHSKTKGWAGLVLGCLLAFVVAAVVSDVPLLADEESANGGDRELMSFEGDAAQTKYVPKGTWGGKDIRLVVGATETTIEYPCADGGISGRMKIDGRGRFKASGYHAPLNRGPVRLGQEPKREDASFEGTVSSSKMTLKVTLTASGEVVGNYELKQNVTMRLHRCL
jgi:hypothetical protein